MKAWEFDAVTYDGKLDGRPFVDRCARINLEPDTAAQAARCREIAQAVNLDGRPLSAYVELPERSNGSMRAALMAIEAGEMMPAGED